MVDKETVKEKKESSSKKENIQKTIKKEFKTNKQTLEMK